jgi:hypothetical protein
MPITVTTRELSLVAGDAETPPELYDLVHDPGEATNTWTARTGEGSQLLEEALTFLEDCGTAERFLSPRREAQRTFAASPR